MRSSRAVGGRGEQKTQNTSWGNRDMCDWRGGAGTSHFLCMSKALSFHNLLCSANGFRCYSVRGKCQRSEKLSNSNITETTSVTKAWVRAGRGRVW